ncbi:MAG: ABC transporter permease [Oscillospiraceae bacterium]
MKFFKLFKKELKELVTFQAIGGILVGVVMFVLLGNLMGNMGDEIGKNSGKVVVVDNDKSAITAQSIESLKASGFEVTIIEGDNTVDLSKKASELGHNSLMIFPKGFQAGIESKKPQEITIVSELKSFSIMSNMSQTAQDAADAVKESLTTMMIKSDLPNLDAEYVKNPIVTSDVTVVKDKSEIINSAALQGFAMQQSLFIPIIVFILITFATQLNASAIANEKGDKTLETLLSAPVSRLAVLGSKMCASAIFSLLMAGVYMIGFSTYMSGMMGGMSGGEINLSTTTMTSALQNLGLQLGTPEFMLIGIQLFLTISIALTISMILGALAKDLKSAQSLLMPLMFITMIPYFITVLMDVNSLPTFAKILVYAIPFTHTFTATSALLFDNNLLFFGGMAYQIIVLVGVLYLAVRVFSTDKIFTMTLEFKKKRKSKKNLPQE